jgi:hypothetical protein
VAVSSFDGAPFARVEVEHLPDRTYRLWLEDDGERVDLGVVAWTRQLGPEAKRRAVAHLGLDPEWFYVDLRSPQPPYLVIGDRVTVVEDDGSQHPGTVVAWAQGGVHVRVDELGVGSYAPEEVRFPGRPAAT